MKEIKFRAWHKKTKKMINVVSIYINIRMIMSNDTKLISFDDIDLMQYTNIKDTHHKDIYEGDILKLNVSYRPYIYVIDDLEEFYYKIVDLAIDSCGSEIEIIGNVYENLDLAVKDMMSID